jgi:glycogen(starch) synthase
MDVSSISPDLKRILLTTDAVGGVWRYTVDLVSCLTRQGVSVLVASLGPRPSAEQRQQIRRISGTHLRESEFALEWMPNPWRDVDASAAWLLDLAQEFRADLVHLNGYSYAALPWNRPVVIAAHSCVCSWWRAVHGVEAGEEWNEYRRRVRQGLVAGDAITAPSVSMAEAVAREYGIPASKIQVIYNFSRTRTCRQLSKRPRILAAGRRWDAGKNFQLLEQIAHRLTCSLQIASGLSHLELQREMAHASIFAHPALYEPFGLSVLEAARHRCALVLSDIPSLRELWDGAALFLDPRDEEQWIFELNRLHSDPAYCAFLGESAQRRARQYSCSRAIKNYRNLYGSLLGTRRKSGVAAA